MTQINKLKSLVFLLSIIIILSSCSFLKTVESDALSLLNAKESMKNVKFKLDRIEDFSVVGINTSKISSIKDVSITDGISLYNAFRNNSLPASFQLFLQIRNDNPNSKGATIEGIKLAGMQWRLIIDNVETVAGDAGVPLKIPASGETVYYPIRIDLDLYKFFGNQGYEKLMNLALALGGVHSNISNVRLEAKPRLETSIVNFTYPDWITLTSKEFK